MASNRRSPGLSGGWSPGAILRDIVLSWRLLGDPKVSALLKLLLPLMALAYWLLPVDLMTGMPFDDIAVIVLATRLFVRIAPPDAVQRALFPRKAQDRPNDDKGAIDAEWRVIDE